jgi:glycosyltransferase involved in cell wall biosynthesis
MPTSLPEQPLIRVLGLSLYGPLAASHRVRLGQYQTALAEQGIALHIQSLLVDRYLRASFAGRWLPLPALLAALAERLSFLEQSQSFDLALLYAELVPYLPAWLERCLLQMPYIYDFDDAFHLKYQDSPFQPWLGGKVTRLIGGAAAVTAGNATLAAYARRFNDQVRLLPSVVDTLHFQPAATLSSQPFTVGWIGSPSTAKFLQLLVEPLSNLAREQVVRFLVVGGSAPAIAGVQVIELPWDLEREVPLIQSFDVGVMPLPDTPWTRGKCAYKLIQCMACGLPVVASRVGANVDAVPTGCGMLADTADDWLSALRTLAADAGLRCRMGQAGRQWVEQRYSLKSAVPVLSEVIRSVAKQR